MEDLYREDSGPPGTVLPKHAVAAVEEADRLGAAIHRDVSDSRVRPQFRRAWATFYNGWQAYKTLHSSARTQVNPDAVMNMEVPAYLQAMYRWRDALASERGGVIRASAGRRAVAVVGGVREGFPWKTVMVVAGMAGAAWGAKLWWAARQRAKAQAEADKQAERMQLAQAAAATIAPPSLFLPPGPLQVAPPPAWPVQYAPPVQYAMPAPPPAVPQIPPGYVLVRAS